MRLAKLALGLAVPVLFAAAQDPGFNGVYTYVSDSGIEAAIEATVADMNFIKRPIARGRLKDTNPAYKKVTFAISANEISVQYDARSPIKVPADGKAAPWKREDGKTFMVTAHIEGNKLTQTFKNEEGERTNVWQLGGDRKLSLAVTVKSGSLPKPLSYSIRFNPAS